MPKSHQDMRKGGKLSVFLGNIADEEKLDDYISSQFSKDFGFEIYPEDGPEAEAGNSKPIDELLEGFSGMSKSKDAAVKIAKEAGYENASCAIVFINFEYDRALTSKKKSRNIDFIGTIGF